jgi:hypothetical protein
MAFEDLDKKLDDAKERSKEEYEDLKKKAKRHTSDE